MPVPIELFSPSGNTEGFAVFFLDSLDVSFQGKTYLLPLRLNTNAEHSAELHSNGRLVITSGKDKLYCNEKTPSRKRKCPPVSSDAAILPYLDLNQDQILPKCWDFIQRAEALEGRTLAPLTGSVLEVTKRAKLPSCLL